MKEMLDAFYTWLTGYGAAWSSRVSRGTFDGDEFPYLTFKQMPLSSRERDTGKRVIEKTLWELSIWHTNAAEADTMRDTLTRSLEDLILVPARGAHLGFDATAQDTTEDPDRTEKGQVVWRAVLLAECMTQDTY